MVSDRTDDGATPDSGAVETVVAVDPVFLDEQPDAPQPEGTPGSAPGWFRGRRERAATPSPVPKQRRRKPSIEVEDGDEEAPNWKRRIALWIASCAATGYALSLVVHVLLLLLASLYIIHSELDAGAFSTLLSMSANAGDDELDEVVDTQIDMSTFEEPAAEVPDQFVTIPENVPLATFAAAEPQEGGEKGDNGDGGESVGFRLGRPGKVITKGNFTVWTVPEDPEPREDYVIVIEVKIPKDKKIRRYPRRDLVGRVTGTDGYIKEFPSRTQLRLSPFLKVREGVTRLVIPIPNAVEDVRDTIRVESKRILKEKQVIEIVF